MRQEEIYHVRLQELRDHFGYEATHFPLHFVNDNEHRNTQRKGYTRRRLVPYRDVLCQATASFYTLKPLFFLYTLKNPQKTPNKHINKAANPTALQGQGLATCLQSLWSINHRSWFGVISFLKSYLPLKSHSNTSVIKNGA